MHNGILVGLGVISVGLGGLWVWRTRTVRRVIGGLLVVAGILGPIAGWKSMTVQAASPVVNPTGVPLTRNDTLILAKTLQGQSVTLDAAATPVLFFARWGRTARQMATVQTAINRMTGLKRPVILVSTFFRDPRTAMRTTQAFMGREHLTLPVVVQEGPPTLYVRTVPTLIAMHDGKWVQYHGVPAIVTHLNVVVQLSPPKGTVPSPGRVGKAAKKAGPLRKKG